MCLAYSSIFWNHIYEWYYLVSIGEIDLIVTASCGHLRLKEVSEQRHYHKALAENDPKIQVKAHQLHN